MYSLCENIHLCFYKTTYNYYFFTAMKYFMSLGYHNLIKHLSDIVIVNFLDFQSHLVWVVADDLTILEAGNLRSRISVEPVSTPLLSVKRIRPCFFLASDYIPGICGVPWLTDISPSPSSAYGILSVSHHIILPLCCLGHVYVSFFFLFKKSVILD